MSYIDIITEAVSSLPPVIIYFFLGISAFTENICPPIPGDIIIAFGAFLAGQERLNFLMAYLCATSGSLAGFMFVFWLGLHLGKRFFLERRSFFRRENILKAEEWLRKHGYLIILVNRYIPGIRSVISITSGILRLSSLKVIIMALVGCATWNLIIMYIGLNIGSNWEEIKSNLSHLLGQYNIAVLIILFCLVIILYSARWIRKRH